MFSGSVCGVGFEPEDASWFWQCMGVDNANSFAPLAQHWGYGYRWWPSTCPARIPTTGRPGHRMLLRLGRPGFGIAGLGWETFILLGHSMGAGILYWLEHFLSVLKVLFYWGLGPDHATRESAGSIGAARAQPVGRRSRASSEGIFRAR